MRSKLSDVIANSDRNSGLIVSSLVGRIDKIDITLGKMADSMVSLVRVEERLIALRREADEEAATMRNDSRRLDDLEKAVQPLTETRKWLVAAVGLLFSLLLVAGYNASLNFKAASELEKHTIQLRTDGTVAPPKSQE